MLVCAPPSLSKLLAMSFSEASTTPALNPTREYDNTVQMHLFVMGDTAKPDGCN
jgi:hypothetical protein